MLDLHNDDLILLVSLITFENLFIMVSLFDGMSF